MEGQTLKHRISGKPRPLEQLWELGAEIADALDAAHAKGIVHRDIAEAHLTNSGTASLLSPMCQKVGGGSDLAHETRTEWASSNDREVRRRTHEETVACQKRS
jgi:hypothetical protein